MPGFLAEVNGWRMVLFNKWREKRETGGGEEAEFD